MDILSIDAMSDAEIAEILERAAQFFAGNRGRRSAERLHGKIVFNLFYENSTRTAMSFATAAHRLGASAISLSVERSSVQKGETLEDTARTLNAMRPDALVMRHRENGAPAAVALLMDAPVLNAGDGTNEHPTQAVERAMIEADVSRAKRAEKVDALAAAHILQGAIDALANLQSPK